MSNSVGSKISDWYSSHQRSLPWRELWSKTQDPYYVWISEIFLQQTQIATVIPKYNLFVVKYPSVKSLLNADEDEYRKCVSGLGYYRRFANILRAAEYISLEKSDRFPQSYTELLDVPGIGPYTASAISSICFDEPRAVLDGNVERVICRLNNIQQPPNLASLKKDLQRHADEMLDHSNPGEYNQGIMELGQLICTPTKPDCQHCPISSDCLAHKLETQHLAPAKKIKKKFVVCRVDVIVVKKGQHYGLQGRDKNSKFLKGVQGFRMEERTDDLPQASSWEFKHTITNHRILARVRVASKSRACDVVEWHLLDEISAHLLTSFDKKVVAVLKKNL